MRFKHVEKLIADDRYKQYEIAEMVGYKDFGYYIKVFKKRYGITPNESVNISKAMGDLCTKGNCVQISILRLFPIVYKSTRR